MKAKNLLLLLFIISLMATVSCKKDNSPKPVIENFELGYENSKIAYAGSDFHIDADIVALGKIDRIQIKIHPEHGHKSLKHGDEWELDTVITKFSGLINISFHEHLEVPVYAEEGGYEMHFIVIDQEGNVTEIEEEFEVKHPDDFEAPEISIINKPLSVQLFRVGDSLSVTATVTDDVALGNLYVALVKAKQDIDDNEVDSSNTITILNINRFANPRQHSFTASIKVGAEKDNDIDPKNIAGDFAWETGAYYMLIKCSDAFGGHVVLSEHMSFNIRID